MSTYSSVDYPPFPWETSRNDTLMSTYSSVDYQPLPGECLGMNKYLQPVGWTRSTIKKYATSLAIK